MMQGTLVAGRFELLRAAGRGGMSTVYQAFDRQSQRPVALKVLHRIVDSEAKANNSRLIIEAQVLNELRHEGIVSYVAHGFTPTGLPFLAMEWLEGEDLGERLARQPLSIPDSVALLRAVSEALAVAHARGIIHRDIKPSNILLRDGKVERATLLDFGVARQLDGVRGLTTTGALLGTPDYMAPEQARGERELSPSADIFSLGCVLFCCLTGAPPFSGSHLSALLAKLLSDEVPDILRLRPDLPPSLARLAMRMVSKTPAQRPGDGSELLREVLRLQSHGFSSERVPQATSVGQLHLFRQEERLVSVVMSSPTGPSVPMATTAEGTTSAADIAADQRLQRISLRQALAEHKAQVEFLIDGGIVAFLSEAGSAEDLAVQAVRCAFLIKQLGGFAFVAVATGNGRMHYQRPIGEAIDRVAEFFQALALNNDAPEPFGSGGVLLDETTAGLVSAHFVCVRVHSGLFLIDDRIRRREAPKRMPGTATLCIGRAREIEMLMAGIQESADESIARVALFLGEAGLGKTRLCTRFLERRQRSDDPDLSMTLVATASSLEASDGYSLLRRLLLQLVDAQPEESHDTVYRRLCERLDRQLAPAYRQETSDVLADVCRLRPLGRTSLSHTGKSGAPSNDAVNLAFLRFLSAECSRQQVLIVLDNLQWADQSTVRLVDLALRALAGAPLFVLGLGRPEVSRRFPRLWSEHRVQEIRLKPLSARDCAELVKAMLKTQPSPELLRQLSELSLGNPRYLEELILSVSEGKLAELPATLVALLQGRLMALPTDARSLLRAASLFDGPFAAVELYELVRADVTQLEMERLLQLLCELDLLSCDLRQSDEVAKTYSIRDIAVRHAARSLLSREDRLLGERIIAANQVRSRLAGRGGHEGAA